MAEAIRFHLDESVNPAVATGLRRRGIEVSMTQEAGLLGATDDAQLAFASQTGRVLVTQDADFVLLAAHHLEHVGIVYSPKGLRSIGQLVAALKLIHGVLTPADLRGDIEYI